MSHRPTDRDTHRQHHKTERLAHRPNRALAREAVEHWNALMAKHGRAPFSPMLGAAPQARFYFFDVHCPGCGQIKQVDLRKLDRHPYTTSKA
jgi:hypothetical protein